MNIWKLEEKLELKNRSPLSLALLDLKSHVKFLFFFVVY